MIRRPALVVCQPALQALQALPGLADSRRSARQEVVLRHVAASVPSFLPGGTLLGLTTATSSTVPVVAQARTHTHTQTRGRAQADLLADSWQNRVQLGTLWLDYRRSARSVVGGPGTSIFNGRGSNVLCPLASDRRRRAWRRTRGRGSSRNQQANRGDYDTVNGKRLCCAAIQSPADVRSRVCFLPPLTALPLVHSA